MRIANLHAELRFPNRIGQTLAPEERVALEVAALRLAQEYPCEGFNFWGRVEGVLKHYYLIEGVSLAPAPRFVRKQFFWSSEDFRFAELPAPRAEFAERAARIDDYFSGQHEKNLFKGSEQRTVSLGGEDYQLRGKNFTELDRLSLLVQQVEHDCQVVPLGAYKLIPTHQLVPNPNFRGLKIEQSRSLESYVHLRAPELEEKRLLVESDKALEREDFLDPLSQDALRKSWSLQTDESKTEITLRSLLWPGYVGYHRTNSSVFGGVYMGNGIRAQDFPFLV